MIFEILRLCEKDAAAAAEIEKLCFSHPWSEATMASEMKNPYSDFFGAFCGGELAGLLFCIKLCSMNAYGIPFTVPLSPFSPKNMRDTFIRMGWRFLAKSDSKIQDMNGVEIKRKTR